MRKIEWETKIIGKTKKARKTGIVKGLENVGRVKEDNKRTKEEIKKQVRHYERQDGE